jgi:hypothetical protein
MMWFEEAMTGFKRKSIRREVGFPTVYTVWLGELPLPIAPSVGSGDLKVERANGLLTLMGYK